MRIKYGGIGFLLILLGTVNIFAQNDFWKENGNLDALLLKKDLTQAIKEAENSPANDAPSLLRRLYLYYRVVDNQKIALTVRQIAESADSERNSYVFAETIKYAVKDELFKDTETLRIYLQKINFDWDIYGKFQKLCAENRNSCDVNGFDEWLTRKSSEARAENTPASPKIKNAIIPFEVREINAPDYSIWTSRRIDWREKFGLDNAEILNQFTADARENPADLETASRYLKFLHKPAEIAWLAENFSSKQAYDYYELGETLAGNANDFERKEDERREIRRLAITILQKSLSFPFDERDKNLINSRRFRFVSMMPRIGNYEKQLRFWTKSKLAEVYKNANEPQNAQPLVEELAALDKSDILTENIEYLAGAVQAASGARSNRKF